MGDRIIRADEDIRENIAKYEVEIAGGNESVDLRRKLAELFMRVNEFEKAIEAYQFIVKKMGTLDPSIDKAIEKAHCLHAKVLFAFAQHCTKTCRNVQRWMCCAKLVVFATKSPKKLENLLE